jgi:hypothetical protein
LESFPEMAGFDPGRVRAPGIAADISTASEL